MSCGIVSDRSVLSLGTELGSAYGPAAATRRQYRRRPTIKTGATHTQTRTAARRNSARGQLAMRMRHVAPELGPVRQSSCAHRPQRRPTRPHGHLAPDSGQTHRQCPPNGRGAPTARASPSASPDPRCTHRHTHTDTHTDAHDLRHGQ